MAWTANSARLAATPALAPAIDADRAEILASVKSAKPVQSGKEHPGTPWLKDLKIVDLTNVIAGPMVAGSMVRFSPSIIKLDAVKPTYDPWNTVGFGMFASQSKKSILVDLKTAGGGGVMKKLIAWADVIIFNGLDRQMKALGIDWETIQAINPQAILTQVSGWGGPLEGPRSGYLGYDDIVQSSTGVMARFGGGYLTPEEHAHMGTIDVLGGHCAAFATMVALYQRKRTGLGQIASSSLCAAGQLIQVPFMFDYDGRAPFNEPSGPMAKGWNALRRCYETKTGWIFLSAMKDEIEKLETLDCLKGLGEKNDEARTELLKQVFIGDSAENWIPRLKALDIGAVRVGSLEGLRQSFTHDFDGRAYHEGDTYQFISYKNHPAGREIVIAAQCAVRPMEAALVAPVPMEKQGTSTIMILKEHGYSAEDIDRLIAEKAVSISWGKQYLPD